MATIQMIPTHYNKSAAAMSKSRSQAIGDRRQSVNLGASNQVIDGPPLVQRVRPAGPGAVGDSRNLGVGPEAIAVVDERLGADRQDFSRQCLVTSLERFYKGI